MRAPARAPVSAAPHFRRLGRHRRRETSAGRFNVRACTVAKTIPFRTSGQARRAACREATAAYIGAARIGVANILGKRCFNGMRVGYARVSTTEQDPDYQLRALEAAGCDRVFTDQISSRKKLRPQLEAAFEFLRAGDSLVVWKFDRLARSTAEMLTLASRLSDRGCEMVSLTEQIDTGTPGGKVVFAVLAALAEFERDIISERTKEAYQAKMAKGQPWGRRSMFEDPEAVRTAKALLAAGTLTKPQIAARLGICVSTLYARFPGGDPDAFNLRPRRKAA